MSVPSTDVSISELATILGAQYASVYRAAVARAFPVSRRRVGASARLFVRLADIPAAADSLGIERPTLEVVEAVLKGATA